MVYIQLIKLTPYIALNYNYIKYIDKLYGKNIVNS